MVQLGLGFSWPVQCLRLTPSDGSIGTKLNTAPLPNFLRKIHDLEARNMYLEGPPPALTESQSWSVTPSPRSPPPPPPPPPRMSAAPSPEKLQEDAAKLELW